VQAVQQVETREISRDVQEVQDVRQVEQVVERQVHAVSQSIDAVVTPQPSPQAVAPSPPVVAAAPVVTAHASSAVVQASQPVANAAPAPVIEAKSTETAMATAREIVEQELAAVTPAPSAPVVTSLQAVQEAAARPAPAASRPGPRADYRWVGEALGERVRQLLVYPAKARLNNVTGRVVVKVVIREDGHLHDIEVVRGSGHDILDEAAIELVRRACPLKMKHALGRPQVTITLPVVYELVG
jgi:protein TonB